MKYKIGEHYKYIEPNLGCLPLTIYYTIRDIKNKRVYIEFISPDNPYNWDNDGVLENHTSFSITSTFDVNSIKLTKIEEILVVSEEEL